MVNSPYLLMVYEIAHRSARLGSRRPASARSMAVRRVRQQHLHRQQHLSKLPDTKRRLVVCVGMVEGPVSCLTAVQNAGRKRERPTRCGVRYMSGQVGGHVGGR